MGEPVHAASLTGGGGAFTGWNDQNLPLFVGDAELAARRRKDRRLRPGRAHLDPVRQNLDFAVVELARRRHLRLVLEANRLDEQTFVRLAGATAGPRSPPLRSDSREVSLRSPLVLLSPWH